MTVDIANIGIVESIDGEPLPKGRVLADEVECNQFQDAEMFLANHGKKGPQVGILRPGTYRINTKLFNIAKAPAVKISENTIGVAVAKDGIPLPTGYIIAPKAQNKDGTEADHKSYQNGQLFIDSKGYRGPQLDTLQPGIYYTNPNLFDIKMEEVTEVSPGYVGVIRSNVGLELERSPEGPERSAGEGRARRSVIGGHEVGSARRWSDLGGDAGPTEPRDNRTGTHASFCEQNPVFLPEGGVRSCEESLCRWRAGSCSCYLGT